MKRKIKLNIMFKGTEVVCAKSLSYCKECKEKNKCEKIEVHYDPFPNKDIKECFKNDERHR